MGSCDGGGSDSDVDRAPLGPVGGSSGDPSGLQRLRWEVPALLKLCQCVDDIDISKFWSHGQKTRFWYSVLNKIMDEDYKARFVPPHINTLSIKFFEVYEAFLDETRREENQESSPAKGGRKEGREVSDARIDGQKELTPEIKAVLRRIMARLEPLRETTASTRKRKAFAPASAPAEEATCEEASERRRSPISRAIEALHERPCESAEPTGFERWRDYLQRLPNYHIESSILAINDPSAPLGRNMNGSHGPTDAFGLVPSLYAQPQAIPRADPRPGSPGQHSDQLLGYRILELISRLDQFLESESRRRALESRQRLQEIDMIRQLHRRLEQKLEDDKRDRAAFMLLLEQHHRYLSSMRKYNS